MRITAATTLVAAALLATTAVSAEPPVRGCSPAGAWYGGSEGAKYQMSISPLTNNSYLVEAEGAYSVEPLGYSRMTVWRGELTKIRSRWYELRLVSILVYGDPVFPTPTEVLETDAVRGVVAMNDCNQFRVRLEQYAYYLGWGFEPFIDDPESWCTTSDACGGWVVAPGDPPIIEHYRRIAME